MIKAPRGNVWTFVFAGCVLSSLIPPMSAGFSLAVVIMSLILWLLWFVRYRHRQTAGLVRYSHLLLGVTLPLISSNMQSGTDIDPRGIMVMVEATSNKNQSQHLRATSFKVTSYETQATRYKSVHRHWAAQKPGPWSGTAFCWSWARAPLLCSHLLWISRASVLFRISRASVLFRISRALDVLRIHTVYAPTSASSSFPCLFQY